jgi:hypothetical protein
MRLRGVWLVLFVLAACGSGRSGDSPEAVCRRQANDDPGVKHFAVENLGPASANPDVQYDYDKALRDATNACLRQKGIQVRGGVEQVRP